MRSLRSRLTVAYAVAVAVVLGLGALCAGQLAFEVLARPTLDAVQESATTARRVAAANPNVSFNALELAIVRAASHPGVSIVAIPNGRLHNSPAPQDLPVDGLMSRFQMRPIFVPVHGGTIVIAPDFRRTSSAFNAYVQYITAALVVAIVVAWFGARWLTAQALNPLLLVTAELERFGSGDFSTRPVATGDRTELGRLATAYNAAATQVTAAFEERERVAHELRTLLGDAGHALRTPLTVVNGFIDVIDSPAFEDPRYRERTIRSMRTEARRMRRLVESLMSLARMEQTETRSPARVDVTVAAQAAIEHVRAIRGGVVSLSSIGDGTVVADPNEVHEAVVNLVENAVKYGAGTPVAVDISKDATSVVVRVTDGGPGIPEEERERIFERFFRGALRASVEGSGLGLAIVARAVDRCGGSVKLDRGDPGHTSFVLRFPIAA